MKFLNKLFKKGESEEPYDPVIDEAFPFDPEDELGHDPAFEPNYSHGYEAQLSVADPLEVEAPKLQAPVVPVEQGPNSEWSSLRLKLLADPRSPEHHAAVRRAISLREERIDFYEELATGNQDEPYHGLSLARAYRAAGQSQDAVPHYQRYLRTVMEAEVFEELAEVYSSIGQTYLASSARQIAQSILKGDQCSSSKTRFSAARWMSRWWATRRRRSGSRVRSPCRWASTMCTPPSPA